MEDCLPGDQIQWSRPIHWVKLPFCIRIIIIMMSHGASLKIYCLFKRLFKRSSKKHQRGATLLAVCEGDPTVTGGIHSQRGGNAKTVSMSWRHNALASHAPDTGLTYSVSWCDGAFRLQHYQLIVYAVTICSRGHTHDCCRGHATNALWNACVD